MPSYHRPFDHSHPQDYQGTDRDGQRRRQELGSTVSRAGTPDGARGGLRRGHLVQ